MSSFVREMRSNHPRCSLFRLFPIQAARSASLAGQRERGRQGLEVSRLKVQSRGRYCGSHVAEDGPARHPESWMKWIFRLVFPQSRRSGVMAHGTLHISSEQCIFRCYFVKQ
jgi:hypothetical protein